jgi:hypothetical protein
MIIDKKLSLTKENPLTGIGECHITRDAQKIRPSKAGAPDSRRTADSGSR